MRTWLLFTALAAVGLAAEEEKRRLESVTWDPVKHQLQWVISKGKMEGTEYKPAVRERYEIDIDGATMSFSDETRRFSKMEADSVRRLLDFLARYAAESTVWWEKGYGEVVKKGMRVSLPAETAPGARSEPDVCAGAPASAAGSVASAPRPQRVAGPTAAR